MRSLKVDRIESKLVICTDKEKRFFAIEKAEISKEVKPGDIIVADKNFGCGSSREHAPISIKGAGVSCVIAKSFARIFFRNCINIGLPIIESDEAVDNIDKGDKLEIDLSKGEIKNITKKQTYKAQPFPEFMQKLIKAGGLLSYIKGGK